MMSWLRTTNGPVLTSFGVECGQSNTPSHASSSRSHDQRAGRSPILDGRWIVLASARESPAIPKLLQVGSDGSVQLRAHRPLLAQRRRKALHLLLEWLAVVLGGLRAYVTPGREHVAVL